MCGVWWCSGKVGIDFKCMQRGGSGVEKGGIEFECKQLEVVLSSNKKPALSTLQVNQI